MAVIIAGEKSQTDRRIRKALAKLDENRTNLFETIDHLTDGPKPNYKQANLDALNLISVKLSIVECTLNKMGVMIDNRLCDIDNRLWDIVNALEEER